MTPRALLLLPPLLAALAGPAAPEAPAAAAQPAVPSGQTVTLIEVIREEDGPEGRLVRFRFLAPAIGTGEVGFDAAAEDMQFLCDAVALPQLAAEDGPLPERIVISLSDRPLPFGQTYPEATQFFEAYAPGPDGCAWEPF